MEYRRVERTYSDWQVGGLSIVNFLVLYLVCGIASLIFIWRTGWQFQSKVIVTVAALVIPVIYAFYLISTRQATP